MTTRTCLFLLTTCFAACQKNPKGLAETPGFSFEKTAALPAGLDESSGLERDGMGRFWSFNDAGGKDEIYGFDAAGKLESTLKIKGAKNTDWEDIARNPAGNLFIGDFGNNGNDRKDLLIYKIAPPPAAPGNASVDAEKIAFKFPDQTAFPPPDPALHFDVESLFEQNGSLFFLTRSRSVPFVGKARLYRLPSVAGSFTAEFLGEFSPGGPNEMGQITAADISPDGSVLALLSNERLYLFRNFTDENFLSGDLEKNDLPPGHQMEGLVFQDGCTLFLTNEANPGSTGQLFKIRICP